MRGLTDIAAAFIDQQIATAPSGWAQTWCVMLNGNIMDSSCAKDLELVLQSIIDGDEVILAQRSIIRDEAFVELHKITAEGDDLKNMIALQGRCWGSWRVWTCLQGTSPKPWGRFTCNGHAQWMGAFTLEEVTE